MGVCCQDVNGLYITLRNTEGWQQAVYISKVRLEDSVPENLLVFFARCLLSRKSLTFFDFTSNTILGTVYITQWYLKTGVLL